MSNQVRDNLHLYDQIYFVKMCFSHLFLKQYKKMLRLENKVNESVTLTKVQKQFGRGVMRVLLNEIKAVMFFPGSGRRYSTHLPSRRYHHDDILATSAPHGATARVEPQQVL